MGSITGIFTRENSLHPAAREVMLEAIDRGWADPQKIHHPSRQLSQLLDSSRESLAYSLGARPESVHFLGEPHLGFFLGIAGLQLPRERSFYPSTARLEAIAVAQAMEDPRRIDVDLDGLWSIPDHSERDLLILPTANLETGNISPESAHFQGRIFVDATAGPCEKMPTSWGAALWEASSWRGPAGLGIFAVQDEVSWRNPLPHLDGRKTPASFSPALAIAAAVALEGSMKDVERSRTETLRLNSLLRRFIVEEIGDVDIASSQSALPQMLSFSFLYVDAEQLVDRMSRSGFLIDSGSACTSANLEPSHVLAAMGRLTHGNVRVHLYPELTEDELFRMLQTLKQHVLDLRSSL